MKIFILAALFTSLAHGFEPMHVTCEVAIDEDQIVRVKTKRDKDLYVCFGYAHGRYRAWQMDYLRKITQGRASEVSGHKLLKSDIGLRLLNFRGTAKQVWSEMWPEHREYFEQYTLGINYGLKKAYEEGVYEFQELAYQPEPWIPVDTLSLLILQAFDQTKRTFEQDITDEKWKQKYPKELFSNSEVPWLTSILKKNEYPPQSVRNSTNYFREPELDSIDLFANFTNGGGSNNWVIGPKLSESGNPWVANDPHLKIKHPPFWFWLQIETPTKKIIGASLPGVPAIISGTNGETAWGLTNAYADVADVVYVKDSELEDAESYYPLVWIRLFWKIKVPFFFKKISRLPEGLPVLPINAPEGYKAVLRWSGFQLMARDLTGLFDLIKSHSAKDVEAALKNMRLPSWNYVYADKKGNIGYQTTGLIPNRKDQTSFGIDKMKRGEILDWIWLTPNQAPQLYNPKRNFIATANNQQWPENIKPYLGHSQTTSFRAFRIEEMIQKSKRHNFESLKSIQCDSQLGDARFLLPLMLEKIEKDVAGGSLRLAYHLLKKWDYHADKDSQAAGLYIRWYNLILASTDLNVVGLYNSLKSKNSSLHLLPLFQQAVHEVTREDGSVPTWGEIHKAPFQHLSGLELSHKGSLPTVGYLHSINLGDSEYKDGAYEHTTGPSQRLIVELTSSEPNIYWSLPGPNLDITWKDISSQDSPWQAWVNCEYKKVKFNFNWQNANKEIITIQ